jgi:hypothetical protein
MGGRSVAVKKGDLPGIRFGTRGTLWRLVGHSQTDLACGPRRGRQETRNTDATPEQPAPQESERP